MFKGTNKVWKGIALALCLCMLPTVALATANTVDVYYDDAVTDNVSIAVEIFDSEDAVVSEEVTILALRRATTDAEYSGALGTVGTGTPFVEEPEELQKQIIYIDQKTADANGNVEFVFAPTAMDPEYRSPYIDVYVGGTNVDTVKHLVVKRELPKLPTPAGAAVVGTWYQGADLVLNVLPGELEADEVAAWADGTTAKFTATGDAIADLEIVDYYAEGQIVIPNDKVAGRTITKIEFVNAAYNTVEFTHAGLKETLRPAGTLGTPTVEVTAEAVTATIPFTGGDEDWVANIGASSVTVDEEPVGEENIIVGDNVITVTLPGLGDELEKTYAIKISVEGYTDADKNVTAKAPTQVAVEALVRPAPVDWADQYYEGYDETDPGAWIKKKIHLPATVTVGEDTFDVTWSAKYTVQDTETIDAFYDLEEAAIEGEDGYYYLARVQEGQTRYTLTATIASADFATAEISFLTTTNALGVAGVDVEITPAELGITAAVAKDATITLNDIPMTWDADSESFKETGVIQETPYAIQIVRLGYFVIEETITFDGNGEIVEELPTMVPGDTDGTGEIDIFDVEAVVAVWNSAEVYADIDGSGEVDIFDVEIIVSNWGATGTGTNALND